MAVACHQAPFLAERRDTLEGRRLPYSLGMLACLQLRTSEDLLFSLILLKDAFGTGAGLWHRGFREKEKVPKSEM